MIKSKYYASVDDIMAKYDIPEEARDDVEETVGLVEDLVLYFTMTTMSN